MKDDEGEVMIGNINEEIRNFLYPILCFIFHKADIRSTPHKKIHETFFFLNLAWLCDDDDDDGRNNELN
jgi:uncharacterized membrane protein